MRTWIVILLLVAALYWEYRHRLNKSNPRGVGRPVSTRQPMGVVRSTGSGVRQSTQFSTTGSRSPGSGSQVTQPAMHATWAIGGVYGPGNVGPTYLPQHASKSRAS
jgi:hypothetical protein